MNNSFKTPKKTYRELKDDPFVKTPLLSWILDRSAFYVALGVVGAVGVGIVVKGGVDAYQNMIAPVEKPSAFLALNPKESLASKWAVSMASDAHGIADWHRVDSVQPSHGWLRDVLGAEIGDIPLTMTAASAAAGKGTKIVVQTYGAGQGRHQFDVYASKLKVKPTADADGVQTVIFGNGFMIAAGDSITAVSANNEADRNRLLTEYRAVIGETLPKSECIAISAATDTAARSYLYGEDKYTGLIENKELETRVDYAGLPTFTGLQLSDVGNLYATQPEGPLPASIPKLPKQVDRPTVANQPAVAKEFKKVVGYQIADPKGPGCGWNWTAQKSPVYDEGSLSADRKNTIESGQVAVDDEAQGYVDGWLSWATGALVNYMQIDRWNVYVRETNSIHAKWDALVAGREAFRPQWDTYLQNYEDWSTFDARKAAAKSEYDKQVAACKVKQDDVTKWGKEKTQYEKDLKQYQKDLDLWEKIQSGEVPMPDPAIEEPVEPNLRDEPKPCEETPERPGILDTKKPTKPTEPTPPTDVTIPDSWQRPQ